MAFVRTLSSEEALAALPVEIALRCPDGIVRFPHEHPWKEQDLGAPLFIELDDGCRLSVRAVAAAAPWWQRRAVSILIVGADGSLRHLWGPAVRLTTTTPEALLPRLLRADAGEPAAGPGRSMLLCERLERYEERAVATLLSLRPSDLPNPARLLIVDDRSSDGGAEVTTSPGVSLDLEGARHRLRNHIQGLLSAVRMQKADETHAAAQGALDRVLTRLQGLHRAHAILDDDGDDAHAIVEFSAVARRLTEAQAAIYPARVELSLDLSPISLPRGVVQALARVLAELVNNALTHAFAARGEGRLWLSTRADAEGWTMTVRDDGVGWTGDDAEPPARLGLTLVRRMVGDLDGSLSLSRAAGVTATVRIPRGRARG